MNLQPHEQRVVAEFNELRERHGKLCAFIASDTFTGLPEEDRELLVIQENLMDAQSFVLARRIKRFTPPTLAGGKLDAVHPNHRPDLAYILDTLCQVKPVLKNEPLSQQVEASINGMRYIIKRTEEASPSPSVSDGGDKGEPAQPIPGDYERRINELTPELGMPRAVARADLELDETRAHGVGGDDGR